MDYGLNEHQKMIVDLARKIADNDIRPVSAHYDQCGELPRCLLLYIHDYIIQTNTSHTIYVIFHL